MYVYICINISVYIKCIDVTSPIPPQPSLPYTIPPLMIPQRMRMMSGDESVCVDIAARADGRFKAALILKLYRTHPCYFLLFSLLTGWARSCGLVRGTKEGEDGVMKTGEFHALILHTLNVLAKKQIENQKEKKAQRETKEIPEAQSVVDLHIDCNEKENEIKEEEVSMYTNQDGEFEYLSYASSCPPEILGILLITFLKAGSDLQVFYINLKICMIAKNMYHIFT
jgi:hypothetical protein